MIQFVPGKIIGRFKLAELVPLLAEDFKVPEACEDIFLTLRAVSYGDFMEILTAAHGEPLPEGEGTWQEKWSRMKERECALSELVRKAYVKIEGIVDLDGPVGIEAVDGLLPQEGIEVLKNARLIPDLFAIAKLVNELPEAKKKAFGLLRR